ncbi:MAG: FAD-dependent monooxygenase [Rudaea sp.]
MAAFPAAGDGRAAAARGRPQFARLVAAGGRGDARASARRRCVLRGARNGAAAHVVHPLAGQGVNLGLRDAALLADLLAQARADKRDIADAAVLRRYERRRRSDNALSAHAFDLIQRGFGSASPALAALRGAGLALVDHIAPLKHLFARHAAGG